MLPESVETFNNYHKIFNKSNVVHFMNHGFFPESKILKQEDSLFKYEATLYLELLKNLKTENLTLLDIGCGRGGELNIFKKYLKLKKVYGCDINRMAIKHCKKNHKNINFKICSSEKLNYDDKYFDLITNVESFHLYKNKEKFFKEAARVLKNKGRLLMTDIDLNKILFDNSFKNYFKIDNIIDITPNVAFACKHNIKNFNRNIENEETRNWWIDTCKEKFYRYLELDTYFIIHLIKI